MGHSNEGWLLQMQRGLALMGVRVDLILRVMAVDPATRESKEFHVVMDERDKYINYEMDGRASVGDYFFCGEQLGTKKLVGYRIAPRVYELIVKQPEPEATPSGIDVDAVPAKLGDDPQA